MEIPVSVPGFAITGRSNIHGNTLPYLEVFSLLNDKPFPHFSSYKGKLSARKS